MEGVGPGTSCSALRGDISRVFTWFKWEWTRSTIVKPSIEQINAILSALCVGAYVYNTYSDILYTLELVSFISSWTFLVEYVAKFIAAPNKLKYMVQVSALIDLVTILQGFVSWWDRDVLGTLGFIRLLRMFTVVRFFVALSALLVVWISDAVSPAELELYKRAADLFIALFAVVFIGGAAFYEIEGNNGLDGSPETLHQAWYWACVTITTVGYGDFYPNTALGQMLFPVLVVIILIVLPNKIARLSDVLSVVGKYMRKVYKAWRYGQHVVLLGHVNHLNAMAFIDEYFHPDRGVQDMDLVLLHQERPGPELSMLLTAHRAHSQMRFLQGSPFVTSDLARTDLARSIAVFVLSDQYTSDPAAEDMRTLLVVLSISQFLRQFAGQSGASKVLSMQRGMVMMHGRGNNSWRAVEPSESVERLQEQVPHIIAQFHLPETILQAKRLLEQQALHPRELGMLPVESTLFPVCSGSLKHALLGASLHAPGLLTLLTNLATTTSVPPYDKLEGAGWVQEYLTGAGKELYEITFPAEFHGLTFAQATEALFAQQGVILLAVRKLAGTADQLDVLLAPFEAPNTIVAGASVGYIMSDSQELAVKSSGGIMARSVQPAAGDFLSKSEGFTGQVQAHPALAPSSPAVEPTAAAADPVLAAVPVAGPADAAYTVLHQAQPGPGAGPSPPGLGTVAVELQAMPGPAASAALQVHTTPGPAGAASLPEGGLGVAEEPQPFMLPQRTTTSAGESVVMGQHSGNLEATHAEHTSAPLASRSTSDTLPTATAPALASMSQLLTGFKERHSGGKRGAAAAAPPSQGGAAGESLAKTTRTWMPGTAQATLTKGTQAVNQSRQQRQRLQRLHTRDVQRHRLARVDELAWKGERDLVLITGNSCFEYLDDLLSAIYFNDEEHRALWSRPSSGGASRTTTTTTSSLPLAAQPLPEGEPLVGQPGDTLNGDPLAGAGAAGLPRPAPVPGTLGMRSRYHSLARARVVIMDPAGPTEAQEFQISKFTGIVHLRASPLEWADYSKLHLPQNCVVRALVLPNLSVLDESAALGATACVADAQTIQICSNIRQYCCASHKDADLEIWAQAVQPVNVPYLLPLCMRFGPYQQLDAAIAGSNGHAEAVAGPCAPSTAGMKAALPVARAHTLNKQRTLMRQGSAKRELAALYSVKVHYLSDAAAPPDAVVQDQQALAASKCICLQHKTQVQKTGMRIARVLGSNPSLAPTLATGHVYTGIIIDKLFCQALFNPLLLQILAKLLGVWDDDEGVTGTAAAALSEHLPPPAAGQSPFSSSPAPEALTAASPHVYLLPLRGLVSALPQPLACGPAAVQWDSLAAPQQEAAMAGTLPQWHHLFMLCVRNNILPIGLHRRDTHAGFPYVYTAPATDTQLRATDEVYVIARPAPLQLFFQAGK